MVNPTFSSLPRRVALLRALSVLALTTATALAAPGSIFDDEYQGEEVPAEGTPAPATDDPDSLPPLPDPPDPQPDAGEDDSPADDSSEDPADNEAPPEAARPPLASPAPVRGRPPTAEKQAAADELVRDILEAELKDKSRAGRRRVAELLLQKASETDDDPAVRYVMLVRARDLAADMGRLPVAMQAVEMLETNYWVDGPRLRVEAVLRSRAGAASREDHAVIGRLGLKLLDQLTRMGYYRHLGTVAPAVRAAATKSGDKVLAADARRAAAQAALVAAEFERAKAAADRLKTAPDDPAANLAVGRFLCLYRGDWKEGVPKLLKGSDPQLREIAALENMAKDDSDSRKTLAAAWWELAEAQKKNSFVKKKAQERACAWYGTVLDELSGLERVLAQKRIEEARRNGVDTSIRPATGEPSEAAEARS